MLAIAPTIGWLFVARIIAGFFGASFTTGAAYIADVSTPEKRAQNFGLLGAAFGLGFIIGPVTGGLLGEIGPRVPFYAAAGLTLLNWLYGYFILPESLPIENRRPFQWKRANPMGTLLALKRYPAVASLIGSLTFIYVASHAVQGTWAYFSMEKFQWSEAMVGYSLGVVGVLSALVQGLLIRIVIPKLGSYKALITGIALNLEGLILFSMASQGWMLFVFLVPYALGGIVGPFAPRHPLQPNPCQRAGRTPRRPHLHDVRYGHRRSLDDDQHLRLLHPRRCGNLLSPARHSLRVPSSSWWHWL